MRTVYYNASVDPNLCTGCSVCENVCVANAISMTDNDKGKDYVPPCQNACPASVNVQGYVALAGEGKIQDAYRLIRENNPFPSVCGRVCTHPCETKCNRGSMMGEPVAIVDIKRYVADYAFENRLITQEPVWPKNGKSVGIIGAGPSGLSCAYYLALTGYSVDVYESQPVAGGVLAFGIPQYRLPEEILQQEIDEIKKAGVEIHLSTEVGKNIEFEELRKKHQAVYIATGAQLPRKVGIPGEDLEGIYGGLSFLRDFRLGEVTPMGKKLVVIGGGNTSIDVARTAVRLGCEDVTLIALENREDMSADPYEIVDAEDEGIKIIAQTQAVGYVGNNKVEGITCCRTETKEVSPGRRIPVIVEGSESTIAADMVINAVNQYSDLPFIKKDEVEITKWGSLVVDKKMMTAIPGVFSGGDAVRGTDMVITAIADGKEAAQSIHNYLGAEGVINSGAEIMWPGRLDQIIYNATNRSMIDKLPSSERKNSFDEVALGLTNEQIAEESRRCFRCGRTATVDPENCFDCRKCIELCQFNAITMIPRDEPRIISINTEDVDQEAMIQLCKRAHLDPEELICQCTGGKAKEVAAAVLKGAKTPTDITRLTGLRTSCGYICMAPMFRVLNEVYDTMPDSDKFRWYNTKVDMWHTSEDVDRKYPQYRIKEDNELFKVGIFHNARRI